MSFVHLHCHSQYSLLDGVIKPVELLKTCQDLDMPAVAITDNGTMFGAIDFYLKAKSTSVTPILGCELVLAHDMAEKKRYFDRLVFLAISFKGYQSLIQLVSMAHIEGFYYVPRIDLEHLKAYTKDLVVISHGYQGPVADQLKKHNTDEAKTIALQLQDLYQDNFYLGLQKLGEPQEDLLVEDTVALSQSLNIPLVATNDVYYLQSSQAQLRDILNCIQTGKRLEENTRLSLRSRDMYFKTADEMKALFKDIPEAISNTVAIANKVDIQIETEQVHLPHFECPDNLTSDQYLEKLVAEGIAKKYPDAGKDIHDRVNFEMDIIKKMQYPIYFLIIYDFLAYCHDHDIPVGPGRGSAAGSIVAYALDITHIDPIKYNLLFERFLNPERVSMPDIDIDFCIKRRGEVIDYIVQKYGADHVAQIATFGTMAARAVVRDVGRALNVPLSDVDKIAKLIPSQPGHQVSIPDALEQVPELRDYVAQSPEFTELLDIAAQLEGAPRHTSTHAAGVAISKDPLQHVVPLMQSDGQTTTQYPMGDLERIGLLKMDILGLRNLTVLQDTVELVKIHHDVTLDLLDLPMDDQRAYDILCDGHTIGVFQLESRGMRQLIKDLKPAVFEDIIALLALYRPGPLGSGMVNDFISNKNGSTQVKYDLPELEPILKDTYGLILYQEQVMQIASVIGGFSLGEADMLRRAMGKKKKDVMDKMKDQFLDGAKAKAFNMKKSEHIFNLCYKFAEYGFNKSHSAAYALISYQTAYLKANYPTAYMTALLSSVQGSAEKTSLYIQECQRMGLTVLSPNVNQSLHHHTMSKSTIQFGLGAIKNVGDGAIESIVTHRQSNGNYADLIDFLMRVDLKQANKRVIESLIKSGACDDWQSRGELLATYETMLDQAQIRLKEQQNGQTSMFGDTVMFHADDTLKKSAMANLDVFEKLKYEKEVLGIYLSGHPLDSIKDHIDKLEHSSATLTQDHENTSVHLVGLLQNCRQIRSKNDRRLCIGQLEDLDGQLDIVLFETPEFDRMAPHFIDDTIVRVTGKVRHNQDEISLNVTDLIALDPLSLSRKLHIDLANIHMTADSMQVLKRLLNAHRGDMPTYFHYNSHTILAGKSFWIDDSPEALNKIESLVGPTHMWVM